MVQVIQLVLKPFHRGRTRRQNLLVWWNSRELIEGWSKAEKETRNSWNLPELYYLLAVGYLDKLFSWCIRKSALTDDQYC